MLSTKFHAVKTLILSKFESFFQSNRKHNFYYRILAPFAIFSIILVCLSAGISWYLLGNRYDQKLREANRQILEQIQQYADQTLYSNTMNLFKDCFLGEYTSLELTNFFSYGSKISDSGLLKSFQQIGNLSVQNDYIDHITLYQKKEDLLLDNTFGLRYHVSDSIPLVNEILPLTAYLKATDDSPQKLIYLTENKRDRGSRDSLTLLHSIPLYSSHSESQGFIAVHLNEDLFLHDLKRQFAWTGGLFILSPEGEPLFKNTDSALDWAALKAVIQDAPIQDHYYYDFTYKDTRYCLTWVKSEESGWTYLSYVPINILKEESTVISQFILMFILLTILCALIAVQKISSRVYRPIHQLRAKFGIDSSLPDSQDDLKAIEEAFSFLENQIDDIKKTTCANIDVLRYKILIQLLHDNDCSADQILKPLELCGITFGEPGFCLILLDFEPTVFYSLDFEQRGYLTEKAKELIDGWFKSTIVHVAETHPDNQVVVLMNLDREQYDDFLDNAGRLTSFLHTKLHAPVNQAVSGYAEELKEICRLYRESRQYLRYFFICNYGNTFTPDFVRRKEGQPFALEEKERAYLEALFRTDHIPELTERLADSIRQIHEGPCSYQDANTFVMQIYGIAFRLCKETGLFEDPVRKNQIITDFNQSATLDASMECIYFMIHLYHEARNTESRSADVTLIGKVTDYIDHHCHDEVTLPMVAELFHISTSHLSRLFKSVKGQNFSVYVMNQKLATAASLLRSCPDQSISQIAEGLGYYTPAYFTRIFKEKFGVTPSQYRKGGS